MTKVADHIELVFSTPLLAKMVENKHEIQREFELIKDRLVFKYIEILGKTHKLYPEHFSNDVLETLGMSKMIEAIDLALREYCSALEHSPGQYKMTSWFTSFDEKDYGNVHDHGNAHISGCYYYKTNGNDGNIFFLTPAKASAASSICFQKHHSIAWEHQPIEGKMLLFPGWLLHGVRPNNTKSQRISLSFNIVFEA